MNKRKVTISILQLKEHKPYSFMGYGFAKEHGFTLKDYKKVFSGEIEMESTNPSTTEVLEETFRVFNCNIPLGFKGHSLSVSDIVVYKKKKYYCDSCDWKEVGKR